MKINVAVLAILYLTIQTAYAEVLNQKGIGTTKSEACADAKTSGKYRVNSRTSYKGSVTEYGTCDCSRNEDVSDSSIQAYTCNVDVYYDVKK